MSFIGYGYGKDIENILFSFIKSLFAIQLRLVEFYYSHLASFFSPISSVFESRPTSWEPLVYHKSRLRVDFLSHDNRALMFVLMGGYTY